MNVFEFLGLPADHRKPNKCVQLVKHFDEVTEKNKTGKTFGLQKKYDGVNCIVVVTCKGEIGVFSRTGKAFTNTVSFIADIDGDLPSGADVAAVYMGELITLTEGVSLEQLSGMVNPNRTKPLECTKAVNNLRFMCFDVINSVEFALGKTDNPYWFRLEQLVRALPLHNPAIRPVQLINQVSEYNGDDAFIKQECDFQVKEYNEEGIVVCDMDADWEAGHKGYRKMKVVRGVDYDLRCVGYEEGTGKYAGKVANLIFDWKNGDTIKCMLGKGWTHDDAEEMLFDILNENPYSVIGSIFQVYALQESSKGKLRLAKVGEQRHDKDEADV